MIALGYILLITTDTFKFKLYFSSPYIYINNYVHFFMALGNLLLLYAVYYIYKHRQQSTEKWLYAIDSTRAQVLYWGNSVAAILFLLIGLHAVMIEHSLDFAGVVFRINIRVLIPFIGLLSFLTMLFTRMFVHDFNSIKTISREPPREQEHIANKKHIHFWELRQFTTFLRQKINIIFQKNSIQKKLFTKSGQAAHDLRTPLTILSMLSIKARNVLSTNQWHTYNNAIIKIKSATDELLKLQSLDRQYKKTPITQQTHYKYIALLIMDFLESQAVEHPDYKISLNDTINKHDWFILINIYIEAYHMHKNAILTTNHYYHPEIQSQCIKKSVTLLPKPLISRVIVS